MQIIKTPHLDDIPLVRWFVTDYNAAQLDEIEVCLKNEVWITGDRRKIPVREMSTAHIKNTLNCWEGKGIAKLPADYLGGREKWLKIFNQELQNRQ